MNLLKKFYCARVNHCYKLSRELHLTLTVLESLPPHTVVQLMSYSSLQCHTISTLPTTVQFPKTKLPNNADIYLEQNSHLSNIVEFTKLHSSLSHGLSEDGHTFLCVLHRTGIMHNNVAPRPFADQLQL